MGTAGLTRHHSGVIMQISPQGVAALELEEGVVLRAYRDAVGVWTIGCGLTRASGVVVPKAGMMISREQAAALLHQALARNYEPAVAAAMPGASQQAFDAGVSFHFNTGAIGRATWVGLWRGGADPAVIRASMAQWTKGGGKVVPGLVARRAREADMLLNGVYRQAPGPAVPAAVASDYARWGMILSRAEIDAARAGFRVLGYDPGGNPALVLRTTAEQFQRDHGLTVDGIIGRATLSAVQRGLDARSKAVLPAVAVAAVVPATATGAADQITNLPWAGDASLIGAGLWSASLAWRYRDVIAALINGPFPRLAAVLRSF